jgi:hypothetical protein
MVSREPSRVLGEVGQAEDLAGSRLLLTGRHRLGDGHVT